MGESPKGWMLVPVQPTKRMLEAAEEAFFSGYTGTPTAMPEDVWAKMLGAVRKPRKARAALAAAEGRENT